MPKAAAMSESGNVDAGAWRFGEGRRAQPPRAGRAARSAASTEASPPRGSGTDCDGSRRHVYSMSVRRRSRFGLGRRGSIAARARGFGPGHRERRMRRNGSCEPGRPRCRAIDQRSRGLIAAANRESFVFAVPEDTMRGRDRAPRPSRAVDLASNHGTRPGTRIASRGLAALARERFLVGGTELRRWFALMSKETDPDARRASSLTVECRRTLRSFSRNERGWDG